MKNYTRRMAFLKCKYNNEFMVLPNQNANSTLTELETFNTFACHYSLIKMLRATPSLSIEYKSVSVQIIKPYPANIFVLEECHLLITAAAYIQMHYIILLIELHTLRALISLPTKEQSDLSSYCLQYRQPKYKNKRELSRMILLLLIFFRNEMPIRMRIHKRTW